MQRTFRTILAAAAAATALAGSAQAAPTLSEDDVTTVRCMVIAVTMAASKDPEEAKNGLSAALYFLGRWDARHPTAELEGPLKAQLAAMSPSDYAAQAKVCGAMIGASGQVLVGMGQRLQAEGK